MKQKGIIKLEGTSEDITFYKSKDGFLARAKGGVSKERIKNDPKFARVRENDKEFGSAAKAGKYLRDAIRSLMKNARDFRVVSRLTLLMSQILKLDTTSKRGDRNVGVAIALPAAKALLKGFEFNNKSQIGSILYKPYSVDILTGKITINNLVPINDITPPQGATDLTLRGAYSNVNFADGVSATEFTNEVNLPIDGTVTTVSLTPAAVPAGTGTKLYFLQIEFFQTVNAVQYELNNGAFNALVIAEIA
ncbi:MAG: hypothetical protein ABI855_09640 [Bacteroidota bacterium]